MKLPLFSFAYRPALSLCARRALPVGFSVFGILVVSACATREPRLGGSQPGLQVRPGMILVTPDQAMKHGLALGDAKTEVATPPKPLPDSSAVLTPAGVKVYSLGRYADPSDPDLLHEAHLVYRRESAARWNLQPGPAGQVLIGNRIAPADPKAAPVQSQEVQGLLQQLQREQAENRAALERIRRLLEQYPVNAPAAASK